MFKKFNKKLLTIVGVFAACLGGVLIPQLALADVIEYPAETALNFISYTPGQPTPGGNTPQTGDILIWIGIAFAILFFGVILFLSYRATQRERAGMRQYSGENNKSRFLILLAILVIPVLLAGGIITNITKAGAAAQEFVSPTIDVFVNTEGGPIHYGEGEKSNIQTYTNNTDSTIFIDEVTMESENTEASIGNWKAELKDGTIIFDGTLGDSFVLDDPITLKSGESFQVTWSTDADSTKLLPVVGTSSIKICYKTYDAQRVVTFESNGGSEVKAQHVYVGEKVVKPVDPTREHNDFVYWATDEGLAIEYNFDAPVENDFTLYAKWVATEEYKEEVEKEIDDRTAEIDDIIDDIDGLTEDEKQEYKDKIDEAAEKAKEAIEAAETEEEIQKILDNLNEEILDIVKEAVSEAIDNEAAEYKDKIDDIENLSDDDKARYKEEIDEAAKEAKEEVEAAKSAEEAIEAKEEVDAKIQEITDDAKELGDTKEAAYEDIREATGGAASFIEESPYLADAEKEALVEEVDSAKGTADDAVEAATTIDEVEKIKEDLEKEVLDIVKDAADTIIDNIDSAANKDIKDFSNLSDSDKKRYGDEINAAAKEIKADIEAAKTQDEVEAAIKEHREEVDKIIKEAKELDAKKGEAYKNIESTAEAASKEISEIGGLSDSDRARYEKEIKDIVDKAKNNVAAAQDVSAVTKVVEEMKKEVSDTIAGAKDLGSTKEAAHSEIKEISTQATSFIDSSAYLTGSEKAAFDERIKKAKETVEAAVAEAATKEEVGKICDSFELDVLDIVKDAGETIVTNIDSEAKGAIDKLSDLSSEDKAYFASEIDKLAKDAKDAIEAAKTQDDIVATLKEHEAAISMLVEEAKALNKVKGEAYNTVNEIAVGALASIEAMSGLSETDVTRYKDEINSIVDKADEDIASTHEANEIAKVVEDTKVQITILVAEAEALSGAKEAAYDDIDGINDRAFSFIDSLTYLTEAEKDKLRKEIADAKTVAEKVVADATNKDDIDAALATFNGAALDVVKDAGTASIDTIESKAEGIINSFSNLSDSDKTYFNGEIKQAGDSAKDSISSATSIDDIDGVIRGCEEASNNIIKEAKVLDDTKAAAYKEVVELVEGATEKINALDDLSQADKKKYTDAIDALNTDAKSAIQELRDEKDINTVIKGLKSDLQKLLGEAEKFNEVKHRAKVIIEQKEVAAEDFIKDTGYITAVDREQLIAEVNSATDTYLAAVTDAASEEAVEKVIVNYDSYLDTQYRAVAAKDISSGSSQAKEKIASLYFLSTIDKSYFNGLVAAAVEVASAAIEEATSLGDISDVVTTFDEGIAEIIEDATRLNNTKEDAYLEIIEAENTAISEIKDIEGLSSSDVTRYVAEVTDAADKANSDVASADSEEGVKNVLETMKASLAATIAEAKGLGVAKIEAAAHVNDTATAVINDVEADALISSGDKTAIINEVNAAKAGSLSAIEAATDTSAINTAVATFDGVVAEVNSYIASIREAKEWSINNLTGLSSSIKDFISRLSALSEADKERFTNKVDETLATYIANIKAADRSDVESIYGSGYAAIDGVGAEADEFNTVKDEAYSELDGAMYEANETISFMEWLSTESKDEYKAQIASAREAGQAGIASAEEASAVASAVERGIANINAVVAAAEALRDAKIAADSDLTDYADAILASIKEISGLSETDIARYTSEINANRDAWLTELANAKDVDAVSTTVTKYKGLLDTIKTGATTLGGVKEAAYRSINLKETQSVATVNGLALLSEAQKEGYITAITSAKTSALNNVAVADSTSGVTAAYSAFTNAVEQAVANASALNSKKAETYELLTSYAEDKTSGINNMSGLISDDKTDYVGQITAIMSEVEARIIASDEAGLTTIASDIVSRIDSVYTGAKKMSDARAAALSSLDTKVTNVNALIDTMVNATAAERMDAKSSVTTAKNTALTAINTKVSSTDDFDTALAAFDTTSLSVLKDLGDKDILALTKAKTDWVSANINQWDAATINTELNSKCSTGQTSIEAISSIDSFASTVSTAESAVTNTFNSIIIIALAGTSVTYSDASGNTVTNKAGFSGEVKIKVVCTDDTKLIDTISDGTNTYTQDESGFITVALAKSLTITTTLKDKNYTVTVSFGDGQYTGTTPTGWTKDASAYKYTRDYARGTAISSIISDFDTSKVTAPENSQVAGFDKTTGTISEATTITMQYSGIYNYMVTIYDIKDGQVTFGGAIGADNSCLEVDGHASHSAGKHCIHEDSWEEIVKNVNEGHADYYSECIEAGCTKAVPISLNSTIGTVPSAGTVVKVSTLYDNINSDYRRWNYSYIGYSSTDPASQWETSRLRATLNGYNNTWGGAFTPHSTYAGSNNLTKDNCLLSCFPTVLQNNIKTRTYTVASRWNNSGSYDITSSVSVTDKLWLPNANEVYGTSTFDYFNESTFGYTQFTKQNKLGITTRSYSKNKYYNESGSAVWAWLRCPYRGYYCSAGIVDSGGGLGGSYVSGGSIGFAPCFIV